MIEASHASAADVEWRKDLDQRLFNLLLATDGPAVINPISSLATVKNSQIDDFIKALEKTARQTNQSGDYLRLAVWQDWSRGGEAAIESAQRAVALDSKNIAAREQLVDFAVMGEACGTALNNLRQLVLCCLQISRLYQRAMH